MAASDAAPQSTPGEPAAARARRGLASYRHRSARRMPVSWEASRPIYRQLRERIVAMILDGTLSDGDALPSIRQLATAYGLSPLTVLKGYQQLLSEQHIEHRRGRGMYVSAGASAALLREERRRFLELDWPRTRAIIARLGLSAETLLAPP